MTPDQIRLRYAEVFEPRQEWGPDYNEAGRVDYSRAPREVRKLDEQYRRAMGQ